MSDEAKTLMYWIGNMESDVADNESERAYCARCAFAWAAHIIAT